MHSHQFNVHPRNVQTAQLALQSARQIRWLARSTELFPINRKQDTMEVRLKISKPVDSFWCTVNGNGIICS